MSINYQKLSEIRHRIIAESKDNVPRMEMFQMYMLAEQMLQTIIIAYRGKDKDRFMNITEEEADEIIEGINHCIEIDHGKGN